MKKYTLYIVQDTNVDTTWISILNLRIEITNSYARFEHFVQHIHIYIYIKLMQISNSVLVFKRHNLADGIIRAATDMRLLCDRTATLSVMATDGKHQPVGPLTVHMSFKRQLTLLLSVSLNELYIKSNLWCQSLPSV